MVRMKTLGSYANYFTPNNNYCQTKIFTYSNLYLCKLIIKIKCTKILYLLKLYPLHKDFSLNTN